MQTNSASTPKPESTAPEKFAWLLDRYFRLDRDDALIERLESLFQTDAKGNLTPTPLLDPLTGETRGLMVLGNSGTGKSALIKRTLRTLPMFELAGRESDGNTLYVTVPPEATIKSLAGRIAKDLGYVDINSRARAHEAWDVARHRMRERGIRLLVIDETHHLLRKGSGRDVEGAVQTLKSLLQGDWPVAVIAAGVHKLRDGIMTDPETDRRFPKFELSRLEEGSKEARTFARSMQLCAEKIGLSLPPDGTLPERILFAEAGEAGRSIHLAKAILRRALDGGRTEVTIHDARRAFVTEYGDMPTSPFLDADWATVRDSLLDGGWSR